MKYITALEKLVAAQDRMLVVYRTQNLMRGPAAANALREARDRVEKAKQKVAAVKANEERAA